MKTNSNSFLSALLRSRKFWAAVVGSIYSVLYIVRPDFPIPEESVIGVVGTLASYILGTALEDGLSKQGTGKVLIIEKGEENEHGS